MGVAVVKDADGSQHEVGFSSQNQNEQLVAVLEPGKLDVEVANASFAAKPGETVPVRVKVTRATGLKGDAQVEVIVPAHLKGISAAKVVIPAGQDEGKIEVVFGVELSATLNMPLTVRATLVESGRPVVAETKLELVRVR
jgi:hypothetical protein